MFVKNNVIFPFVSYAKYNYTSFSKCKWPENIPAKLFFSVVTSGSSSAGYRTSNTTPSGRILKENLYVWNGSILKMNLAPYEQD